MPNPPPGFEWDEVKARRNLALHRLSFALVPEFEFNTALRVEEQTHGPETRFVDIGRIGRTLCVLVWTARAGRIRAISLRKAERNERRAYLEAQGY